MKYSYRIKSIVSSRVTNNIIWLVLERGVQVVIGFIITGILARSLGTQGYGMYQYASAILAVVMSLTFICGSEVLVPLLTRSKQNHVFAILFNAFLIRFVTSLLVYVGLIVFLHFSYFSYDLKLLIGLWGLVLFIAEPFAVIKTWMESNTYIKPNVVIRIVSLLIKFFLVYLFYIFKLELFWIGIIFFIEAISLSFGQIFYFRKSFQFPFLYVVDRNVILSLIKSGGAFFIGILFMILFTKIDKLVLREFVSFSDLGIYTSAMSFTDQLSAIAPIISISFAPMYVYNETSDLKSVKNVFRIVSLLAFIAIVLSLIISLMANSIIQIILGNLFVPAASVLTSSIWISILVFVDSGFNLLLYKNKVYRLLVLKWIAAFIINTFVVFLLVKQIGIYAGVIGVYSGYFFSVLISLYYIYKLKRSI